MTDTRLPAGLEVKTLVLTHLGQPFAWFRVERTWDGRIYGSGFDALEAITQARRELERRKIKVTY